MFESPQTATQDCYEIKASLESAAPVARGAVSSVIQKCSSGDAEGAVTELVTAET